MTAVPTTTDTDCSSMFKYLRQSCNLIHCFKDERREGDKGTNRREMAKDKEIFSTEFHGISLLLINRYAQPNIIIIITIIIMGLMGMK
jgi:hypothetical protein